MGSIGAPELIVLLLFVGALVVVVKVVKRSGAAADLVPCRACGRHVSPRAETCPQCGEPRVPLRG